MPVPVVRLRQTRGKPLMKDLYKQLLEMMDAGEKGVMVTITEVAGSSPRHAGSKMIVRTDGRIYGTIGGGKLEKEAIEEARSILNNGMYTGMVKKKTYDLTPEEGMLCGGQTEVIFESFGEGESLTIFGAGHIGRALAPLAQQAGFRVTVVDNRPEYATRERFPGVENLLAGDYTEMMASLKFTDKSYVVIVTHGHAFDEDILGYCVQQPHRYIGMIGSRNKTKTVLRHLEEKGIAPEVLRSVHSPVGLNIGAETPFEISVSILSEVVAVRHGVDVGALSMALDR